jgi:putative transposase
MSVPDANRLKELERENTRLKKLLTEALLEAEATREVLRKKWSKPLNPDRRCGPYHIAG